MGNRNSIADLVSAKKQRRPIVAVSCYDYTTARLVADAGVDMILAGDSAAQLVLGYDTTLPVTMDFMVTITAAVRRGAPNVFLVADMPFLSYQVSQEDAVRNAGRFLTEAGAQMVKMEITGAHLKTVGAVSDAGIAVMAHIGIRPQQVSKVGRFKAEATTAEVAVQLVQLAQRAIEAGADALLVEGTAAEVGRMISERVGVPVIGCGSGAGCDGQILVLPDILGLAGEPRPKFAKAYGELGQAIAAAVSAYSQDVGSGRFPDDEHCYHMKPGEAERLELLLRSGPRG